MFQRGGFAATVGRWFSIVNISSAIFDRSAQDLDACPDESLPEFAFIGRSNVGKSSLLNLLAGKQGLARVSAMPGFTKLINTFTMNKTWRLVDLPGYGFAQVARTDKAKFNESVAHYLQNRPNLCCVFSLIDSSLPPQKIDLEFVEWLINSAIPFVLVFTKIDKVSPATVQANIAAFTERISEWCERLPAVFICSATERHGRSKLLGVIEEGIAAYQSEAPANSESTPVGETAAEVLPASGRSASAPAVRAKHAKAARPW